MTPIMSMRETALSYHVLNNRIDIGLSCGLEVDSDRHMELEFIYSVASILNDVVLKGAGTFRVELILISDRMVSLMNNAILGLDARLAIEHFCLAIQLINHICQVALIEKHLPIERMQVGGSLTEL